MLYGALCGRPCVLDSIVHVNEAYAIGAIERILMILEFGTSPVKNRIDDGRQSDVCVVGLLVGRSVRGKPIGIFGSFLVGIAIGLQRLAHGCRLVLD